MSTRSINADLMEIFVLGRDMPAVRWQGRMGDRRFRVLADKLVWQANGTRFLPGDGFVPEGPVSLAHPVELDAEEILHWRNILAQRCIRQPFLQMWESVVLENGMLPGKQKWVQSAGEDYKMLNRYGQFHLPLTAVQALKKEDFQFIVRRRYDRNARRKAEIQVINVVTPAGILYGCKPDTRVDKLSSQEGVSLILGPFYPFEGVRLRTLNHVAAALEEYLISEMVQRGKIDMLRPHLPGMSVERMKELLDLCDADNKAAAMLRSLIAREEVARS